YRQAERLERAVLVAEGCSLPYLLLAEPRSRVRHRSAISLLDVAWRRRPRRLRATLPRFVRRHRRCPTITAGARAREHVQAPRSLHEHGPSDVPRACERLALPELSPVGDCASALPAHPRASTKPRSGSHARTVYPAWRS